MPILTRKTFVVGASAAFLIAALAACDNKQANAPADKPVATQTNDTPAPQATQEATPPTAPATKKLPTFAEFRASLVAQAPTDPGSSNLLQNIQLAEKGDTEAEFWLGAQFHDGSLFQADNAEAFKYFSAAAEKNNQAAEGFLASMYEHGESVPVDMKKAVEWYTKCSKGSNKEWADRALQNLERMKTAK